MTKNQKIFIVAAALIFVILVVLSVANPKSSNKNPPTKNATEVELGGPKTVAFSNMGELSKITLAEQFIAIKSQLNTYILTKLGPNITEAKIVKGPVVENDGTITFTVETKNPTKLFIVHVDRHIFYQIVFTVDGTDYKQTVRVFGVDKAD